MFISALCFTANLHALNLSYNARFKSYANGNACVLQHILCVASRIVGCEDESVSLLVVGVEACCTVWLALARNGGKGENMVAFDEIYDSLVEHRLKDVEISNLHRVGYFALQLSNHTLLDYLETLFVVLRDRL